MSMKILGVDYRLVSRLSESESTRVILAESADGTQVVFKFHADPDIFFDELARYYACGESHHFCKILYNVPPFSVSGDASLFSEGFLRLFGKEALIGQELDSEEMLDSEIAQVGLLVLEYVKGEPLLDAARAFSPERNLYFLGEMVDAVRIMHENGEFHGKLLPSNVLVDHQNETVKLLGLDYFEGKSIGRGAFLSPDHEDDGSKTGPHTDIYMLTNNFIRQMNLPENIKADLLVAECTVEPEHRPSIQAVARWLGLETIPVGSTLSRPFWWNYLRLSSLVAMVLVSIIGITVSRWDPFTEQKTLFMESIQTNPDGAVEGLVEMRASWLDKQDVLAEAIATARKAKPGYRVRLMTEEDLLQPVAVFALQSRPLVLWPDHFLEIGDWLSLDGKEYFLAGIQADRLILSGSEKRIISFSTPGFEPRQAISNSGVLIWKKPGNLPRLVESIRLLPGLMGEEAVVMARHKAFSELIRAPIDRVQVADGSVYGFYRADSLEEFVALLEPQLNISVEDSNYLVANSKKNLPFHLSFDYFNIPDRTVRQVCSLLSSETGFRFVVEDTCDDRVVDARFYGKTWSEILSQSGLKWEVVNSAGETVVSVSCRD